MDDQTGSKTGAKYSLLDRYLTLEDDTKSNWAVQNVDNVACVREGRDHIDSSFLTENSQNSYAYARASDKVDKTTLPDLDDDVPAITPGDCDNCPAAGYWDHLGPGRWCFHRAYFLGKSGAPSLCSATMHTCPLGR